MAVTPTHASIKQTLCPTDRIQSCNFDPNTRTMDDTSFVPMNLSFRYHPRLKQAFSHSLLALCLLHFLFSATTALVEIVCHVVEFKRCIGTSLNPLKGQYFHFHRCMCVCVHIHIYSYIYIYILGLSPCT